MFSNPFLDENYTLTKILGNGNFVSTYLAQSKITQEFVIIKYVDLIDLEEKDRKLIEAQIGIFQKLSHPNIIKYID